MNTKKTTNPISTTETTTALSTTESTTILYGIAVETISHNVWKRIRANWKRNMCNVPALHNCIYVGNSFGVYRAFTDAEQMESDIQSRNDILLSTPLGEQENNKQKRDGKQKSQESLHVINKKLLGLNDRVKHGNDIVSRFQTMGACEWMDDILTLNVPCEQFAIALVRVAPKVLANGNMSKRKYKQIAKEIIANKADAQNVRLILSALGTQLKADDNEYWFTFCIPCDSLQTMARYAVYSYERNIRKSSGYKGKSSDDSALRLRRERFAIAQLAIWETFDKALSSAGTTYCECILNAYKAMAKDDYARQKRVEPKHMFVLEQLCVNRKRNIDLLPAFLDQCLTKNQRDVVSALLRTYRDDGRSTHSFDMMQTAEQLGITVGTLSFTFKKIRARLARFYADNQTEASASAHIRRIDALIALEKYS